MCFKFGGCFPTAEKVDNRSKRSTEYFNNFNKLCSETIEDLLKKQANNALPYKMILNHELINTNGKAKKIYRIFTNDTEKKKYHGVGWVVTSCVPHCMICREEWSNFIVSNHCYACGNAVCQTFCCQELAILEDMEELGPVRVCKLCHWGQERAALHRTFRPLSMVDYGPSPTSSEPLLARRMTVAESEKDDSIIDLTSYSIEDQIPTIGGLPKIMEASKEDDDQEDTSSQVSKPVMQRPSTTSTNSTGSSSATTNSATSAASATTSSATSEVAELTVPASVVTVAASVILTTTAAAASSSSDNNNNNNNTNTTNTSTSRTSSSSTDGSTDVSVSSSTTTPSTTSTPASSSMLTTTTNPMLTPAAVKKNSPPISPSSSTANLLNSPKVQPQITQLIKEIPKPPRVKTGWLKISTNNGISWRKRFCTIQNGYLSYYANDGKDNMSTNNSSSSNKSPSSASNNSNNNNNKLKGQICLAGYRYQLPSDANKVSLRIDLFYEEEDGQLRVSNSEEMDVLIETIDHVERDAWVQAITSHTDYIEKIHLHDRLVEEEIEHITLNNTNRNGFQTQTNYP